MTEAKAKVVHYSEVPALEIGEKAPGARIRWLIDKEHDGAPAFALRMVEIEPGGTSLLHSHAYEHENFVLEGKGKVLIQDRWHELKPGDAALIPPNVMHQFVNDGDGLFKFLCGIPV